MLRVEADNGVVGYGEGLPRPRVTGETVAFTLAHLQDTLWPKIKHHTFKPLRVLDD